VRETPRQVGASLAPGIYFQTKVNLSFLDSFLVFFN
jgi:hypothetical protein